MPQKEVILPQGISKLLQANIVYPCKTLNLKALVRLVVNPENLKEKQPGNL